MVSSGLARSVIAVLIRHGRLIRKLVYVLNCPMRSYYSYNRTPLIAFGQWTTVRMWSIQQQCMLL